MKTKNNFFTVSFKEVAPLYQTVENLPKMQFLILFHKSESSPTDFFGEYNGSCLDRKIDQVMSSFGFLQYAKIYESPAI